MTMKNDIATIHGAEGSSIGIVLVLFILLVIITSMLGWKSYGDDLDEDGSSGIESAQTFSVFNQTVDYILNLVSFANVQNPGSRIVRSGASQSLVLISANGSVSYDVLNSSNQRVGSFSAGMSSTSGFTISVNSGPIIPYILPQNRFNLVVRSAPRA
ncbi:hypothetical protein [Paenibacillus herberti]|uniref:Uncharacterized protein n=1 Tax=Paenibacillus herberti TaxID=1619309 RepID=A0A229P0Z3_9BACL|nr:hypothetical protein [Paenibacillus herberti]OXM15787.1 hypothetical protein CGZ75_03450 [Paenibacillus herberti]